MELTINQSVKGKGHSYSFESEFCNFTPLMRTAVWTNQLDLCCPSSNNGTPKVFSPCRWMSFSLLEFQRRLTFLSHIFRVVLFFLLDLTSYCDLLTKGCTSIFSPQCQPIFTQLNKNCVLIRNRYVLTESKMFKADFHWK